MPVQHVVLIKLKKDVKKEDIDAFYNALMSLEEKPFINSITAGENFDGKGSEWTFSYVMTISNLRAYKEDKSHQAIVERFLTPIAEEITSVDYEYPRALAERGAAALKDKAGAEEGGSTTPNRMRWSTALSHPDIDIVHGTVARPKSDFAGERFVIGSHPIPTRLYFDVVIELNPRPKERNIAVGLVSQSDLDKVKETGSHFKSLEGAYGWECSSGFVGADAEKITIPPKEWPHDSKVGVWVDTEKGVIQFFLNRKKHGPTIHADLAGHKLYPAVCMSGKGTEVSIDFSASCPQVYIN